MQRPRYSKIAAQTSSCTRRSRCAASAALVWHARCADCMRAPARPAWHTAVGATQLPPAPQRASTQPLAPRPSPPARPPHTAAPYRTAGGARPRGRVCSAGCAGGIPPKAPPLAAALAGSAATHSAPAAHVAGLGRQGRGAGRGGRLVAARQRCMSSLWQQQSWALRFSPRNGPEESHAAAVLSGVIRAGGPVTTHTTLLPRSGPAYANRCPTW